MNKYLEENLDTLVTTVGTVVERKIAVAPEVVRRVWRRIDVDGPFEGVRAGNRTKLARAITLLESTAPAHKVLAQELLVELLPFSGKAMRVGLTGVPDVGKSTTIETLGLKLTEEGHRVAALAIDPSSTKSGGSILDDKTRMSRLSAADRTFIRPSPSAGTLGDVAKATREAMVVLEAAGYDIVIVETVGVGQSEVAAAQMVDTFAFLALAGAGNQLQDIKKGVLEMTDVISINKAGDKNLRSAKRAAYDLMTAMKMVRSSGQVWTPSVLTMSALEDDDIDKFWQAIEDHVEAMCERHLFDESRTNQQIKRIWSMVHETLLQRPGTNEAVQIESTLVERQLRSGQLTPTSAAQRIMEAFDQGRVSDVGLADQVQKGVGFSS